MIDKSPAKCQHRFRGREPAPRAFGRLACVRRNHSEHVARDSTTGLACSVRQRASSERQTRQKACPIVVRRFRFTCRHDLVGSHPLPCKIASGVCRFPLMRVGGAHESALSLIMDRIWGSVPLPDPALRDDQAVGRQFSEGMVAGAFGGISRVFRRRV